MKQKNGFTFDAKKAAKISGKSEIPTIIPEIMPKSEKLQIEEFKNIRAQNVSNISKYQLAGEIIKSQYNKYSP